MELPLQITFRDIDPSPAIEAAVRKRVESLERFFDRITRCRVVVEAQHHHQRKGRLFHVSVELGLPGDGVVVSREHHLAHEHEDVYVAIRDAFNAARRVVEDHARRFRGDVKTHEESPHGRVVRLFPWEGYGFIAPPDGADIYFHRNSVVGGNFDELEVGSEVRYVVQEGEGLRGPQASTVRLVARC